MKKHIFVSCIFIFTLLFNMASCINSDPVKGNGIIKKISREAGDFKSLQISGPFKVFLMSGNTTKIEIETDENLLEHIETKIVKGKLKVDAKKIMLSTKGINIFITCAVLEKIELSGAVDLVANEKLQFNKLELNISGASSVKAEMNCVELDASFTGGSAAILSGVVSKADFAISGACRFDASEMIVDVANTEVSGTADVQLHIITKLDIKASGASNTRYFGEPEMKCEKSGMASVLKGFKN